MTFVARTKRPSPANDKTPKGSRLLTRRALLKGMVIGAGALVAAGGAGTLGVRWMPGTPYRPRFLTLQQFETLEAACERIFPADRDPGAKRLGAAVYIDRLLAEDAYTGEFLKHRSILTKGLDSLDVVARGRHGKQFARLSSKQQDALLGEQTDARFLATLVNVTLDGVFYDPFYGGNRDAAGWRIVGFSPSSSFRSKGLTQADGAAVKS
jgi:gluconate 2-dehydrogenase gamma chain